MLPDTALRRGRRPWHPGVHRVDDEKKKPEPDAQNDHVPVEASLALLDEKTGPGAGLILFSDQLLDNRVEALDSIFEFLDLPTGFRPQNLGKQFHTGGDRERFPGFLSIVRRVTPLRWIWRSLPRRQRKALWVRFFTQFNVVSQPAPKIGSELRERLADFFNPDLQQLSRQFEITVPWNEFNTATV